MFERTNMKQNWWDCVNTGVVGIIYGTTNPENSQNVKDVLAVCHWLYAGKIFWLQAMLLPALLKTHLLFASLLSSIHWLHLLQQNKWYL